MTPKNFIVLIFFTVLIIAACSSENPSEQPKNCLDNLPTSIPGLKIQGVRSEKNVIQNLWPLICRAREIYQEQLNDKPRLNGIVEIKLTVEFNGEIGPYSIVRSTLEDSVFEDRFLRLISFMDFDPYGPLNSETEIILPIPFTS
jgi:hypothetical protein